MIRFCAILVFLCALQIYGQGIKVEEKKPNYGCNYKNDDLYLKNVPSERIIVDGDLLREFNSRGDEFYKFVKEKFPVYHYYRKEISWMPGTSYDTLFFKLNGEQVNFYAIVENTHVEIAGFCFEGRFSSNLVSKFLPKDKIANLKLDGDGVFYLEDDFSQSFAKIVKEKGEITELYVYMIVLGVPND